MASSVTEDYNEIAVYNKGDLLCLVVHSNSDSVCLSDFRSKVLLEQVRENLPANFLFVRHVGEKEITINKKQEHLIKVGYCLKLKDGIPTIYISHEIDVHSNSSKSVSQPSSNERKRKLPAQATLSSCGFITPKKSCEETVSFAKARNVKLYTDAEIQNSTGKTKEYREFWNKKAEEICSEAEFAKFSKAAVHGMINTAWTMQKADDILAESKKIANALKNVPKSWLSCTVAAENTLRKNIERLEKARKDIKITEESLATIRLKIIDIRNSLQAVPTELKEKVKELEGVILPCQLTEIRASEEALRKTVA